MPYQLVVIKGRSNTQTLRVNPEGVTTVGRQDGCQIRISSSQVSRKHCELFEKKGLLLVKDLGSSNGTLVNGKKINGQQVLEPGNMLTVGAITFRIERTDVPGAAAPAPERKPSDTAVADAIGADASGGEDDLEIDFEVEDDTLHDSSPECRGTGHPGPFERGHSGSPRKPSRPMTRICSNSKRKTRRKRRPPPAPSRPAANAASRPTNEPEPEPAPAEEEAPLAAEEDAPEIGEDAVAEYLLNIDLDDEDKL